MLDKSLLKLPIQPPKIFHDNGIKINIHFPLRGEAFIYSSELNKKIKKITKSSIDFSPSSFHIPHITLYTCFIQKEKFFYEVMKTLYDISQKINSLSLSITNAYLKAPNNNYIFLGLTKNNEIINFKKKLENKIQKLVTPLEWNVVDETPHITIGYIKKDFNLVSPLLNKFSQGPSFTTNAIEISYSGLYGTCLGVIRTFEFLKSSISK